MGSFVFPNNSTCQQRPFQIYTIPLQWRASFLVFLLLISLKFKNKSNCGFGPVLFVSISKNNNTFPFSSPVALLPARVLVNLIFSGQSGRCWPDPDL